MNNPLPDEQFFLARKADTLRLRANLISSLRCLFQAQDFLEVETPVRVPSPAPEQYIDAIRSDDWFLQTSPELCMKRLLAAGYPRIFQFCKCFRAGERGARHLPEFSMLEWYIAGGNYLQLMDQCEALLGDAFKAQGYETTLTWQGKTLDLSGPWERLTVSEAFARYAPMSVDAAMARDCFDEILVDYVEPRLGCPRPAFLYDYPAALAALARVKQSDPAVAERFELYMAGMELANGFSELTDAVEQKRRFEEALEKRAEKNQPRYEMPSRFLAALANMPPAAGIALGLDRLIMLLTNTAFIDDVVAFPPEAL